MKLSVYLASIILSDTNEIRGLFISLFLALRETIISTQEKVEENGEKLKDIDEKLFKIITKD